MNLHLNHSSGAERHERRDLWRDNRIWWVNCLAIERYWLFAGKDLDVARGRRDQMLTSIVESL